MQEDEGSGVALRFGASALVTYGSLGAFLGRLELRPIYIIYTKFSIYLF